MSHSDSDPSPGRRRDSILYVVAVAVAGIFLWWTLGNFVQTMAGTIFIATVLGTLAFWRFRLAIAFGGICALLATQTLDVAHMLAFMNLDVILFLISMMIVVYIANENGFFSWLLGKILKATKYDPRKVMIILLILSTLMAAMVDEVTSILFIIALVFEYCQYFDLDPLPYVISCVIATNIGSGATMLGNPVGILIGLRAGLTFEDFLLAATPVVIRSEVFEVVAEDKLQGMKLSGVLLFATIVGVAVHYRIEITLGVEVFTYLFVAVFAGAALGLLWQRGHAQKIVEKGVDWWTLLFFMFLFAKAGALSYTGLTDLLATGISGLATSQSQITAFMLWFSGFGSSLLDNVVLVAALIPVVESLIDLGFNGAPLWWALLFGGVFGGNITMIGSTANIVALGMLEKKFNYHMRFFKWLWIGLLGGCVPMLIGQIFLLLMFR